MFIVSLHRHLKKRKEHTMITLQSHYDFAAAKVRIFSDICKKNVEFIAYFTKK